MKRALAAVAALLFLAGCDAWRAYRPASPPSSRHPTPSASHRIDAATGVPHFAHIVVVVEENHSYADIIGNPAAPYINALARAGTLLTNSYAIRHPSEPNYLALFAGSTLGLADDSCPLRYSANNLGAQLRTHGMRFVGYAESLPSTGDLTCYSGPYARRHAPWTNFTNVAARVGKPMRAFPTDYSLLPRVAFVVPNLNDDMHDGTVGRADTWLHDRLAGYVSWARTHNSVLILTWDEDDWSQDNRIPGVVVGAHVRQLHYGGHVDHYTILRTIEAACGLPAVHHAVDRSPITSIWR